MVHRDNSKNLSGGKERIFYLQVAFFGKEEKQIAGLTIERLVRNKNFSKMKASDIYGQIVGTTAD